MKLRLDPDDEYMHPLEEAHSFNESMYFNMFDPSLQLGGFFRVGNRPNEGHAEVTCCLFLPDGKVAFMYQRPEVRTNDAFDAAGMRFEVIRPFEQLRVAYEGPVLVLADPLDMIRPREAFGSNPVVQARLELDYHGLSPMYGGEPEEGEQTSLRAFARGHYEQHVRAEGIVEVGDRRWEVNGYGLRDHSWGPRYWQAPWWYRWLNACLDPELGFMVTLITTRDGDEHVGGMVFDEGRYDPIVRARIHSSWRELRGDTYHDAVQVSAQTESGRTVEIEGRPVSTIPLRNRRKDGAGDLQVTRITETMMRYAIGDRSGYGIAEYLDQMVDGHPVGVSGESEP